MIDPDIISEYEVLDAKLKESQVALIDSGVTCFNEIEPVHGCWKCKSFVRINLSCIGCRHRICGNCGACRRNLWQPCQLTDFWKRYFTSDGVISFAEMRRLNYLRREILSEKPGMLRTSLHEQEYPTQ